MYSHEIENLLKLRNYIINNEEYFNIVKTSPQIIYTKYESFESKVYLKTNDNYSCKFKVYRKDKQ